MSPYQTYEGKSPMSFLGGMRRVETPGGTGHSVVQHTFDVSNEVRESVETQEPVGDPAPNEPATPDEESGDSDNGSEADATGD